MQNNLFLHLHNDANLVFPLVAHAQEKRANPVSWFWVYADSEKLDSKTKQKIFSTKKKAFQKMKARPCSSTWKIKNAVSEKLKEPDGLRNDRPAN